MYVLTRWLYLHKQVSIFGHCIRFLFFPSLHCCMRSLAFMLFNYFTCRVKSKSIKQQSYQSAKLILIIASLYCLWCISQLYWVNPRRPAVGEEADLGVLVFLATYFFLPHFLCISSMNSKDLDAEQLPP